MLRVRKQKFDLICQHRSADEQDGAGVYDMSRSNHKSIISILRDPSMITNPITENISTVMCNVFEAMLSHLAALYYPTIAKLNSINT